ncbi:Smr/MutS family protein [Methylomonas sp. AM2-LC]|uniref:Smr/MutS family protein n=1 Tax=Methylomonas sp. AM2-LC TaxID=3153301 RepID=UPI003265B841
MTKKTHYNDEENLFRTAIGKVRSIDTNTVILKPDKQPRPIPIFKPLEQVDPLQNSIEDNLETLYQEDKIAFIAPGLQKSVLKKLRKGFYGLDADIDLHGLTSREAFKQLVDFLHDCVEEGCRCVHIVHGKGYHSPENQPVLKNDINYWLRQHKDVLAFCSAPSRAGGSGAVFVLLRLSEKYDINENS